MIGSYFGRNSVKNELRDTFIRLNGTDDYNEIKSALIERTYKAIDSKDYQLVGENVDLLMDCKEYDSFINILSYMGDLLPDLFCKLLMQYDSAFNNESRSISANHYQLIHTNLVRFIGNNRMSSFAEILYSLYLNGRIVQIEKSMLFYDNNLSQNIKNHNRSIVYRQYLDLDRYGLGRVYTECVRCTNYELLDKFLQIYTKKLIMLAKRISAYYSDAGFAERLKQVYVVDFEIKKINMDLTKAVQLSEIDGRQINILLRTLVDIYCEIERIELEEVDHLNSHKYRLDTLSSDFLKDSYYGLIREMADNGLLTAATYYKCYYCHSVFIKETIADFKNKVIDTI